MNSDHRQGAIAMIVSSVAFSAMAVLVRVAADHGANTWESTEFRFLFSIVAVLCLGAWRRQPLRFVNRRWLVSRGVCGGIAVVVFFWTINAVGVAKATIFTYTYPIWAGMLAPLVLGERVRKDLWLAVAAGFAGLYLIIAPADGLGGISRVDLIALAGGVASGWAVLAVKKLSETDSSEAILFAQSFFGLLIVVGPAHAQGFSVEPTGWLVMVGVGVFAVIGQLTMNYSYLHVNAAEGSLLSMLTPAVNVVFGLLFFQEPVSGRAMVGCALVLISCGYAALPPRVTAALAAAEAGGRPS